MTINISVALLGISILRRTQAWNNLSRCHRPPAIRCGSRWTNTEDTPERLVECAISGSVSNDFGRL